MTGQLKATVALVIVEKRQQMGIPTTTLSDSLASHAASAWTARVTDGQTHSGPLRSRHEPCRDACFVYGP